MFLIPTPQVFQKIVTGLDDLYEHDIADQDMQGDLYEYVLGKLSTAGQHGQFRAPKHIREMMVGLVQPTPNDDIRARTLYSPQAHQALYAPHNSKVERSYRKDNECFCASQVVKDS